jgi:hypothetical protein
MKPAYEHVEFGEDCSVRVYHRRLARIPFEWHHHPEYELTLTMNSHGKRYIGDSVSDYQAEDLVLVPPDLPHTWSSNKSIDAALPQVAIVIWFDGDWARRMADCCREYEPLRKLLRRAASGLAFAPPAGERVRTQLDSLLSNVPRYSLHACRRAGPSAGFTERVQSHEHRTFRPRTGAHQPRSFDDRCALRRTAAARGPLRSGQLVGAHADAVLRSAYRRECRAVYRARAHRTCVPHAGRYVPADLGDRRAFGLCECRQFQSAIQGFEADHAGGVSAAVSNARHRR